MAARARLRGASKQRASAKAGVEAAMMAKIAEKQHEFSDVVEARKQLEEVRQRRWEEAEQVRRQGERARLQAEVEARQRREATAAARRVAKEAEEAEMAASLREQREVEERRVEQARQAAKERADRKVRAQSSVREAEEHAQRVEADTKALLMRVGLPVARGARRPSSGISWSTRQEAKEEAIFAAAARRQGVVPPTKKREDEAGAKAKAAAPWAADRALESFMSSALEPLGQQPCMQQPRAASCPAKVRELTTGPLLVDDMLKLMPADQRSLAAEGHEGHSMPTACGAAAGAAGMGAEPLAVRLARKRQAAVVPGGWTVWE